MKHVNRGSAIEKPPMANLGGFLILRVVVGLVARLGRYRIVTRNRPPGLI